ncbi:MAG: TetR/AcrR family transcriptional regulator, partial [Gemmatimonadetes bacterium]|nr:TetR/AcrR family transcriptional regulator [Gemmatimonadota bacterium]
SHFRTFALSHFRTFALRTPMSPRPRSTSDEEILAAAARAVRSTGPELTLANVGNEAGVSPAGLVQRFGSKRELLLALAEQAASATPGHFAAARELHASALDALLHALSAVAREIDTPVAMANHLAFLHANLHDAEFHAFALNDARTTLGEIQALLREAVQAGELRECDAGDLSRTVQTAYRGALSTWAIYRSGTLEDWLRGEVEAVLEPYRPPSQLV